MDLSKLGKRVKHLREKSRLTQNQLANSLQISAQAISKWERGENAPDITMLVPLTRILKCSIEWILEGDETLRDTFEATVLNTSIRDFAQMSSRLTVKEVAVWVNSIFHQLTETVQEYGGVPVKYVGDGFLAYFSSIHHGQRAFNAAYRCCKALKGTELLASMHTGSIYLGAIGHPDYSRLDILGDTVNRVFLINQWATKSCQSNLIVSGKSWERLKIEHIKSEIQSITLTGIKESSEVHCITAG